jgi:hypothetical protein
MTDSNEEAEESVYVKSDCEEVDNEVSPPRKRGTKLNYAMIKMFESEELALEEFSKSAMSQRRLCWDDKRDTDARKVLKFRCTVEGCFPFLAP